MKCPKLALSITLAAMFTTYSYAYSSVYDQDADHISVTGPNGGLGNLQRTLDQMDGAIGGLSDDDYHMGLRVNALENAPKAKDGINGTDGHDGTDDHHNDAAIQQNAKALSNDEARIGSLETQSNQNFANLKTEVDDNRDRADAGIAGVAAMANIPQVQESQQFALGAGMGGYGAEQALAVGASFHATQSTIVKLTVSNDTQHNFGWGAGASYGW
ncbi:TPA: YadA C-terminal domain-containing protein [Yersinia enterocolitica]|nr:YadA C-terminal domain-containing protein [Yersinia enterocolitica]HEN3636088.1 YadA C-terminal domain-containing protein [Yersinia enterocolitica]